MRSAQRLFVLSLTLVLLALPVLTRAQATALPDRVARLSLVRGDVSVAPGGSDGWLSANLNRPLLRGDRLYTGEDSRAVLELGGGALRIAERSAVSLVAMNDERIQIEVTQGTVNLAVHRMNRNQTWEVDTPTLAFVADRSGSYRIDIDPDGYGAIVTVLSGQGSVYGERGSTRTVYNGRSYRFDDSDVDRARISSAPAYNDFDRFCADLDSRYNNSISSRYVADNVVGYSDLDHYGRWETSVEYGHIWYPTRVHAGWAPYRDGRWAWIEPWGWTWIDAAPWGFAPFHYGRWAHVHNRWGWVPGPRLRRAVFAPALVAFVGNMSISVGGGAPVGWFPLGPRDIYQPPYRVTENYFININLGNARFFHRSQMRSRWHDYRHRRNHHHFNYAYRHNPGAVTVVSRDDFRDSRLVRRSSARMSEAVLRQSHVERAPSVKPIQASQGAGLARARPEQQAFARPVVARASVNHAGSGSARVGPVASPRGAPRRAAAGAIAAPGTQPHPQYSGRSGNGLDTTNRTMPRAPQRSAIAAPRGMPEIQPSRRSSQRQPSVRSTPPSQIAAMPRDTVQRQHAAPSSRPAPRTGTRSAPRASAEAYSRAAAVPHSRPRAPARPRPTPQVTRARASAAAPVAQSAPRGSSASSGTHESTAPTTRSASPRGRPKHRAAGGIR